MRQLAIFLGAIASITQLSIQPSWAQVSVRGDSAPLELELLTNPKDGVITADTINPRQLTIPSFWWAQEQAQNKLLDNWIAYPKTQTNPGRVDLLVNQQIWALLDYLERYDFVNRMGTVGRDYGYNVRVFNYQQEPLASYTCNFLDTPRCSINLK